MPSESLYSVSIYGVRRPMLCKEGSSCDFRGPLHSHVRVLLLPERPTIDSSERYQKGIVRLSPALVERSTVHGASASTFHLESQSALQPSVVLSGELLEPFIVTSAPSILYDELARHR